MISNPYLPSPSAATAWAQGFISGLTGPSLSISPPEELEPFEAKAFADGLMTGQDAAINGLDLQDPCVSAAEGASPLSDATHVVSGAEILHGVWELRHLKTLAGGLLGLAVGLLELACTLPVHMRAPEEVLPSLGETLMRTLESLGVKSMQLFCGAGLDPMAESCEIRLSPLFRSIDQAREAATGMDRPQWVIVSWRPDACGSFRVEESS